ncbi:MAG: ATP-binding protein [Fibrobacter sp.]|nr:ATP-binding protein [Fibrobacter sp.]
MVNRKIVNTIQNVLFKNKAIIIYGPRQTGKTTLCKILVEQSGKSVSWLCGDDADVRDMFSKSSVASLKKITGSDILVIDEAQRIENIGLSVKLLIDNFPELQVIITGSSSLDIAGRLSEPLTGRKREFLLLPLAFDELVSHTNSFEEQRQLDQRLVFGTYPEVVLTSGSECQILKEIAGSYLYKDILSWETLRHPEKLDRLVKALALQIGSEVSYNELGQITGMSSETVDRYVTLLEQAFIIFRLTAYSRNSRNELKKSRKIYFYDVGIRNALIGQFTPLSGRTDVGALWENYLIVERMKAMNNRGISTSAYFWRTLQQQEIDYIEEINGTVSAYEFKWSAYKRGYIPVTFKKAYPSAITHIISKDNYPEFLTGEI